MPEKTTQQNIRTVSIASGKGGVGKTVVTANLALALARHFDKVVAADLDLGCGNLNTCLGVRRPKGTIDSFLLGTVGDLKSLQTSTEERHLDVICASYSGSPHVRLEADQKGKLLGQLKTLDARLVLLDLGAGASDDVLDLFLAGEERIIVVAPEALSLHNAFVFLKRAILHFLWRELDGEDFLAPMRTSLERMTEGKEMLNLPRLIDRIKQWDRYAAYVVAGLIDDLKIKFIVNMYRGGSQRGHLRRFHQLLFRHLLMRNNIHYLGFVHYDRGIPQSVQAVRPFLLSYPENRAAGDFQDIGARLADNEALDATPALHLPRGSWWMPDFLY